MNHKFDVIITEKKKTGYYITVKYNGNEFRAHSGNKNVPRITAGIINHFLVDAKKKAINGD